MSSLNQVQLIGNLGQDPEIRAMRSGERVANLSLATSERWRDKSSGEQREKTEWHRVVVFGRLVDVLERYSRKGTKLFVQGKLQTRKWQDQNGPDKYTTEIVLQGYDSKLTLLSRAEGSGSDAGGSGAGGTNHSGGVRGFGNGPNDSYGDQSSRGPGYGGDGSDGSGGAAADLDDDIPF